MATTWYIDVKVRLPNKPQVRVRSQSPVNTKVGAKEYERQVRQAILDGTWGKEVKTVPGLATFALRFLEHANLNNKPSTTRSKKQMLDSHILPYFGKCRLDQISTARIEAFKFQLAQKALSKKSINNVLTCLRKLLSLANEWGELPEVPRIHWMRPPKPIIDFLSREEAENLFSVAEPGRWRTMILVALHTGLRIGELCGLQWQDINFKTGLLVVRRALYRGELNTPKSGREREIPLNDVVLSALKQWQSEQSRLPWVFPQEDGHFIRQPQHTCSEAMVRLTKRAGLRANTRRVGWHTLRHTFASHLAMANVPLKAIQELLGHSTIAMTERYAHLSPSIKRDAVLTLQAANQAAYSTPTSPEGHHWVTQGVSEGP